MKRWILRLMIVGLVLGACGMSYFLGYRRGGDAMKSSDRLELEKGFADSMAGATLTGSFTVDGREDDALRWERYTVERAESLGGDLWVFHARLEFGETDLTIPVPVRVSWAGDTPVITLDKFPVPGFGTFSARIVIHDSQYAGTWDGGDGAGVSSRRHCLRHDSEPDHRPRALDALCAHRVRGRIPHATRRADPFRRQSRAAARCVGST